MSEMNDFVKVLSQIGTENIVVDGYRYGIRKARCTSLETSWRCVDGKCNVSIKTNSQHTAITYKSNQNHDHPPSYPYCVDSSLQKPKSIKSSLAINEDKYCRLCTSEKKLFTMDSSIRNCLKNEYSIDIKDEDRLSKVICQRCWAFLPKIIKFRELIIEVQKLLQEMLEKKDADSDAIEIIEDAPVTVKTPCTYTSRKHDRKDDVIDLTDTNVSSSYNYSIPEVMEPVDLTKNHLKPSKLISINIESDDDDVAKEECEDLPEFKIQDEQDSSEVCLLCNAKFATPILLKEHTRDAHCTKSEDVSRKKKFRCGECNGEFETLLEQDNHRCKKKYPCLKKCGELFNTYRNMERHYIKCYYGRTIFYCQICQKLLTNLKSCEKHFLMKCSLKISADPEATKKTWENDDEINQAPCSTPIPSSPTKTKNMAKKRGPDNAAPWASKKSKTTTEDTTLHRISMKTKRKSAKKKVKKTQTSELTKVIKTAPEDTAIPKIPMKTKRKSAKKKVKKTQKSKLTKVEIMSSSQKKKLAKRKKKSKIANNSKQTPEQPVACETCGLLFQNLKFLAQHKVANHSTKKITWKKANTTAEKPMEIPNDYNVDRFSSQYRPDGRTAHIDYRIPDQIRKNTHTFFSFDYRTP